MSENKKIIKLVAKVILITMSVILSGVFVLGVLIYLLGYIFINGTPIYNISNSEEKKFEELYTLYLPDDYEFVKGHASGFSPDVR